MRGLLPRGSEWGVQGCKKSELQRIISKKIKIFLFLGELKHYSGVQHKTNGKILKFP